MAEMRAMDISRTGLDVEWRRLEVISDNLANANSSRAADGTPYQGRMLVSGPAGSFEAHLDTTTEGSLKGVEVYGVEPMQSGTRLVHEPGNPQADANGMVSYPAIDQALQMTMMVKTARAYQSNIVAMNAAREMYSRAIDLGEKA
jgi:flagellar basal-body rod protein FlgC